MRWDSNFADWNEWFQRLQAYYLENGHCNIPKRYLSLGPRCQKVRRLRKDGHLSVEQIAQLDDIKFVWGLTDKDIDQDLSARRRESNS